MRRYLAYRPGEVPRIYHIRHYVSAGAPGHGPVHSLVESAIGFRFSLGSEQEGWIRGGLAPLLVMAGPVQHFREAFFRV